MPQVKLDFMTEHNSKNQKMFSILMATYNCGRKVENTLDSIFAQNKDLFELIVIDGASTDKTLAHIKKYEPDLTLISEKDRGVYYAFNKGLDFATGKYIYFIGAGDCLRPGILETMSEFLSVENPSLIYGNCYFTKQKLYSGRETNSKSLAENNICHQGIFYHRAVFDIVGKYDLQYKIFADWFFNFKCFIHDEITTKYVDRVIADYEEGGLSSKISNDPVFMREFPLFVKKKFGIFNYLRCRISLNEPHIFKLIYFRNYFLQPDYWISKYSNLKNPASFEKRHVLLYRNIKKAIKDKIQFL